MSYTNVLLPVKTVDGETVLVADLPIAELSKTAADVFGAKVEALWPALFGQSMTLFDAYADQKMWPTIRAEVDRSMAKASTQITWMGLIGGAALAGFGLYLYKWGKR